MKKIFVIALASLLLIATGCEKENLDAKKFKEEYESFNNIVNEKNGKEYRNLNIDEDNPIVYTTAEELAKKIDKKETFLVYFGFPTCPWCRSILETLLKVCDEKDIDKIYYVNVKDIRDVKELNENGEIITNTEGSEGYHKLLERLDTVLEDYNLTNENGEKINTNEKRIYAPNVVSVVKGKAVKLETGISDKLTDPYMELTEEMINDTYKSLESVINSLNSNKCEIDKSC